MVLDEKESKFTIGGPAGALEIAWSKADGSGLTLGGRPCAIICHPHPMHGGTMDNKVVTTLMRTYRDVGVNVIRFNFRGVGKSEGAFDHSKGELDDLIAVIDWVQAQLCPSDLLLAGFSFGSSIAARASYAASALRHLVLVAPPIERYAYDVDRQFEVPVCVIQGDQDERVIAQGVYQWIAELQSVAQLIRYPEAGHFFHGFLSAMKQDLTAVLQQQLSHRDLV